MTVTNIIELLGGLGAFLFGMKYMGDGLELAAGSKMKDLLEKLTRNRILGFNDTLRAFDAVNRIGSIRRDKVFGIRLKVQHLCKHTECLYFQCSTTGKDPQPKLFKKAMDWVSDEAL